MVSVWGLTDRGLVRKENQDSCAYEVLGEQNAWGVVCDGMGGAQAGDLASAMAVEAFRHHMARLEDAESGISEESLLKEAAEDANRVVYVRAVSDPLCYGMGTTLVGLIVKDNTAWVVNIGDSRAYLVNADGIRQLTRDHSLVEEMVESGDLTKEEARRHPQKNLITRALGTSGQVKPDLFQISLEKDDYLLLCSDGLVNELSDKEIQREVLAGRKTEKICRRLMDRTLRYGAADNVTVVLFKV